MTVEVSVKIQSVQIEGECLDRDITFTKDSGTGIIIAITQPCGQQSGLVKVSINELREMMLVLDPVKQVSPIYQPFPPNRLGKYPLITGYPIDSFPPNISYCTNTNDTSVLKPKI